MGKRYIENPKTRGSGILCCIPQTGKCLRGCADCFFNSRSYLEPLEENLPNMPTVEQARNQVVRVNDGNDSSNRREAVMAAVQQYPMRFYNTTVFDRLDEFDAPVVLTVNPAERTDSKPVLLCSPPPNLMFVRVRTNTWNLRSTVYPTVNHYCALGIPVVLTFMAYYETAIHPDYARDYTWRKRTTNHYWAITIAAWQRVMAEFADDPRVYSCGRVEGAKGLTGCRHCGNCLREYFATVEWMRGEE